MPDQPQGREQGWERGWEGHERAQRRRLAALPLSAKLDWLDEAQEIVSRLAARNRDAPLLPDRH